MGVSKNRGTPKSSILIRFSIITHPFWGTPIFGNIHLGSQTRNPCQTRIQTYRNSIQATAVATQGWPETNGTNGCHVWETLGKIHPTTPSFQPNIVHQWFTRWTTLAKTREPGEPCVWTGLVYHDPCPNVVKMRQVLCCWVAVVVSGSCHNINLFGSFTQANGSNLHSGKYQ